MPENRKCSRYKPSEMVYLDVFLMLKIYIIGVTNMKKEKTQETQETQETKKVETQETQENQTKLEKNGLLSVKQNYLISFDSECLKTPLAKKVRKHIIENISYNLEKNGFIDSITNDDCILFLQLFREIFVIRNNNDDKIDDEIKTQSQENAKNALIEFMQDNSKTFIKKLFVKCLSGAYNDDKLKKIKETNTATYAEYELVEAGFSFVKFIKSFMRKVITHNGKYKIVCDTIKNEITFAKIDEPVEGIEE